MEKKEKLPKTKEEKTKLKETRKKAIDDIVNSYSHKYPIGYRTGDATESFTESHYFHLKKRKDKLDSDIKALEEQSVSLPMGWLADEINKICIPTKVLDKVQKVLEENISEVINKELLKIFDDLKDYEQGQKFKKEFVDSGKFQSMVMKEVKRSGEEHRDLLEKLSQSMMEDVAEKIKEKDNSVKEIPGKIIPKLREKKKISKRLEFTQEVYEEELGDKCVSSFMKNNIPKR